MIPRLLATAIALASLLSGGCHFDGPMNPTFPISIDDAKADLNRMANDPVALERPVVISAGYFDPGVIVGRMADMLRPLFTEDARIIPVAYFGAFDMDTCRERLCTRISEVLDVAPEDLHTIEIDVIGYSMGGLIARDAALELEDGPQLNIVNLYTIATPYHGARLAHLPTIDPRAKAMRSDADYIAKLNNAHDTARYALTPYVRLEDFIVGEHNTMPPGEGVWWVPNPPLALGHVGAATDARLIADIARRLRNESPHTTNPPAPLPRRGPEPNSSASPESEP